MNNGIYKILSKILLYYTIGYKRSFFELISNNLQLLTHYHLVSLNNVIKQLSAVFLSFGFKLSVTKIVLKSRNFIYNYFESFWSTHCPSVIDISPFHENFDPRPWNLYLPKGLITETVPELMQFGESEAKNVVKEPMYSPSI